MKYYTKNKINQTKLKIQLSMELSNHFQAFKMVEIENNNNNNKLEQTNTEVIRNMKIVGGRAANNLHYNQ